MALILHIDTALEKAFVGFGQNGEFIKGMENNVRNDHAAFVQPAIAKMLLELDITLADIDAVGVTNGPGSYTGLRVGMASAKGICYALKKPLLTVTTLEAMTAAAVEMFPGFDAYCPLIDARRNEVFTALYGQQMEPITTPHAQILSATTYDALLTNKTILFFGSGASKWQNMLEGHKNAHFGHASYTHKHLCVLLFNSFKNNQFRDLLYTEPLYSKEFHSPASMKS